MAPPASVHVTDGFRAAELSRSGLDTVNNMLTIDDRLQRGKYDVNELECLTQSHFYQVK